LLTISSTLVRWGYARAKQRDAQATRDRETRAGVLKSEQEQEAQKGLALERRRRADIAEEAFEKSLPCEGVQRCVTITVLQAYLVSISTHDANGYKHSEGAPMQRLTVPVGTEKRGNGIMISGRIFDGHGAKADVLCLSNCFRLEVGSHHFMGMGALQTHWRSCFAVYGDCTQYDTLPYLSIGKAQWQILELCPGTSDVSCLELSTVNSRDYP